ncbi:hypothetical protein V1638_04240 [Pseudarthrobacter sp. J64]|uniref:hypothetical protein n=1 Tax=Pseudarthrobacter sp. J64 TaxID=3116485 RepID=UPI002E81440A|nr:hypothetical protein [Pseudarthrobacter sp. J64]MEE2568606.1 hypothetical protein [Pseudarthrobacter sp. J64]
MKLIVCGTKYPLKEAIQGATLRNLYVLKMQTGIGIKSLRDTFKRMEASAPKPGEESDPLDFLESEDNLLALQAMVWLCKRHAGEQCTVSEANDFPMSQIGFETEEADAVPVKEDPTKARTDSDPGDERPALEASNT